MKKKLLVLFVCLLFSPINILAKQCTNAEKSRLEKLANEIQTTFDYNEVDGNAKFSITFHNVYEDFYLVNYSNFDSLKMYDITNGTIVVNDCISNKTYSFNVIYDGNKCDSYIVKTLKTTTPYYNKYYNDSLCEGIETYSMCQKWNNIGSVSYEKFKKSIEEYKKQQEENEPIIDPGIEDNFWNRARNFIATYYLYMTLGAVIVFIIIIFIYNKRKRTRW